MKRNLLTLLIALILSVVSPLVCAQLTADQAGALLHKAVAGDAQALSILRQYAAQGDARAQLKLAGMYAAGKGVQQDYVEAGKWFRKAADQEDRDAQIMLGIMYDKGWGVSQDYAEAVKWYRKLAEQGDARGQLQLAGMHAAGKGVPENYVQAYKWLALSKANSKPGSETYNLSSEGMEILAKKMPQAQIAHAQQEAAVWVSKHSGGQ